MSCSNNLLVAPTDIQQRVQRHACHPLCHAVAAILPDAAWLRAVPHDKPT